MQDRPRDDDTANAGNETSALTERRIGENQVAFREANERIEATADELLLSGAIPFICECADRGCTEIVSLTLDEYEGVRRNPRLFFNAVGHEAVSVAAGAGVLVARLPDYVLVEKVGIAGAVAEVAQARELGER